jgi:hypothetical protein
VCRRFTYDSIATRLLLGRLPIGIPRGLVRSEGAARGHEAVVKLLLATDRANPDLKDCYGQTPLLLAAGSGYDAVVKLLLAKDVADRDSVDNFGRRPLSWAARRGHSNVVKLLRRSYEDNGIASHDEDVSIATTPAANHESTVYCDICTLWIQDIDIHYHCGICNNGDFDVCRECIASGAFCFDQSHKLVKRTAKENTLVEVLD